jgi:hypothetical protein
MSEACLPIPTHSAVVFLTGLSETSTFNLQWNFTLESFPDQTDTSIAVLAKPSCVYDAMALHILSESLNKLPVGVKASENPFGEWFTRVVSQIADVVSPALAMIPGWGPAASAAAMGVGTLAKYANSQYNAPPASKAAAAVQGVPVVKRAKKKKPPALPPRDAAYQKAAARVKKQQRAKKL